MIVGWEGSKRPSFSTPLPVDIRTIIESALIGIAIVVFCCYFIFNSKSKCISWMRFIASVKRILLPFLGDNRNEYSCRWRLLRVAVCCPAMGISIKWNVLLMRCESLDWLLACRQSSLKFKTWEGIVTFSLIHACSKGRTSVVFAHWWLSMVVWRLLVRYS